MDCSASEPPDPKMPQYLFSSPLRKKFLLMGILKAGQVEPKFSSCLLQVSVDICIFKGKL